METPVAFFIFNRPEVTAKVFAVIRQVKPSRLLVIADGPRKNRATDKEKCEATRAIIDHIDWDCHVQKNYADDNLGCGRRICSGLDWVFQEVEEAIILEDDCLPHPTFFQFCTEALHHYRDDTRVMCVAGDSYRQGRYNKTYSEASYFFSRYPYCWGWASWRRAWQHNDYNMSNWPQIRAERLLHTILDNSISVEYWTKIFDTQRQQDHDHVWDYQWTFACWSQNALTVVSEVNLISNIGFDIDATHTSDKGNSRENLPVTDAILPLVHPPFVLRNLSADLLADREIFVPSLSALIIGMVKSIVFKIANK
jgi:hypothetical protein